MSSHPIAFQAPVESVTADIWPVADVLALFDMPFHDLLYRAQQVHRVSILMPARSSWPHCSRLKPGAAQKIAVIALRRHVTILV